MKKIKGEAGYLDYQKKREIIKTAGAFLIVLIIFLASFFITGSKASMGTVIAMLGVLPASKMAVGAFIRLPYRSVTGAVYQELHQQTEGLLTIYDLVFTSQDNIMPVSCIAITGHKVCGLAASAKTDTTYAEKHIKTIMKGNQINGLTVKIYQDQQQFTSQVKSLPRQAKTSTEEENIKQILLQISL